MPFPRNVSFERGTLRALPRVHRGMKIIVTGLVAALLMAGCSRGRPGDGGLDSGIVGAVVVGPSCPAQPLTSPCAAQPVQAEVRVLAGSAMRPSDGPSLDSESVVTVARTDAHGRFRVGLPPGDYVLEAVPPEGTTLTTKPVPVEVRPHEFAHVSVPLDTGIR
jgi:hypothetical protein